MPDPEPPPETPEELAGPRYALGEQFSKGGMGGLWYARESATGRTIALKRILGRPDAESFRRFLNEARITARLEHPNIVPVHGLGTDPDGQPFYTMKLVQGTDLAGVLKALAKGDPETVSRYPLAQLLIIFQKVCDAVAFAHSHHVIHRDLKPANIMLGPFGEVLVMDWGLAKDLGEPKASPASDTPTDPSTDDPGATLPGQAFGSPHYMAPEQARGDIHLHDPRTDIYALGAVLYQILALRRPVSGTTAGAILARVIDGDLDPLLLPRLDTTPDEDADLPPELRRPKLPRLELRHLPESVIPESLAAVVIRAMAFDPEKRYQTVPELQREITAYQNGFATGAERAGLAKQILLALRRNRREATVAGIAVILLLILAVASFVRIKKARDVAQIQRVRAEKNEQIAKEERHRADDEAKRAIAEAARAERGEKQAIESRDRVADELANASFSEGVRRLDNGHLREGIAFLAHALATRPRHLAACSRLFFELTYRGWPLPERVIPLAHPLDMPHEINGVEIFDGVTTSRFLLPSETVANLRVRADSDRRWQPEWHDQPPTESANPVRVTSPDRRYDIELTSDDGGDRIQVFDARSRKLLAPRHDSLGIDFWSGRFALSPDGRTLAIVGSDRSALELRLLRIDTPVVDWESFVTHPLGEITNFNPVHLGWLPDSKHLVVVSKSVEHPTTRLDIVRVQPVSDKSGGTSVTPVISEILLPGAFGGCSADGRQFLVATPNALVVYRLENRAARPEKFRGSPVLAFSRYRSPGGFWKSGATTADDTLPLPQSIDGERPQLRAGLSVGDWTEHWGWFEGWLARHELKTGKIISRVAIPAETDAVAFCQDGLAITRQNGVAPRVWQMATGRELPDRRAEFSASCFPPVPGYSDGDLPSPDGRFIAHHEWSNIVVSDAANRKRYRNFDFAVEGSEHGRSLDFIGWSPDSAWILASAGYGDLPYNDTDIFDVASGQRLLPARRDWQGVMAISSDGRRYQYRDGGGSRQDEVLQSIVDLQPITVPAPEWTAQLVESLVLLRINEIGGIEKIDPIEQSPAATLERLQKLAAGTPVFGSSEHWLKWFLADPVSRTVSPLSREH